MCDPAAVQPPHSWDASWQMRLLCLTQLGGGLGGITFFFPYFFFFLIAFSDGRWRSRCRGEEKLCKKPSRAQKHRRGGGGRAEGGDAERRGTRLTCPHSAARHRASACCSPRGAPAAPQHLTAGRGTARTASLRRTDGAHGWVSAGQGLLPALSPPRGWGLACARPCTLFCFVF